MLKLHATTFFFCPALHRCVWTRRQIFPLTRFFSKSGAFKCRWNNAALAANGRPRGHNYSVWRRLVPPQPWQVKSNVIVQREAAHCFVLAALTTAGFSIQFSCWEEHRFARTKASPVNISHWLAGQMYLCTPSLFPSLLSLFLPVTPSFSTHPFYSGLLFPQTLPHLSIHPSSVLSHLSLRPGIHLVPFSLSLSFLCVCLSVSSSPPARAAFVWGLCWNVLRDPVSNTGTRNIWHIFNSQGQLQLFIQRLQLNFPRFLLDLPQIAMCVCHILNQASFLRSSLSTPCDFPSNISKAFKWVLDMFYLCLSCAPSFLPQLC